MFKVPDWETDVPKTNLVFTSVNNKKFKNDSRKTNSSQTFIKNTQDDNKNRKTITKPAFNGNANNKKKKPEKRKKINDVFMKDSEGFEMDELLSNAKKIKLNEDETKNRKTITKPTSNGNANNKKKKPEKRKKKNDIKEIFMNESEGFEMDDLLVNAKKMKLNEDETKNGKTITKPTYNENANNKNDKPNKCKKKNDNEDIFMKDSEGLEVDELLINAKKKKLNEIYRKDDCEELLFGGDTKELKPHLAATNPDTEITEKRVTRITEKRETRITEKQETRITEKRETRTDFKKKEKIKKILEQNHRTPLNVTGNNLRARMLDRLKAAQFRYLNEKLYTSSGNEAKDIFESDPTAFWTYHQGYQLQVKKWPVNPLEVIIKKIEKMPKHFVIADMGCGEAALSRRVARKVHSFDLVSCAPGVVACDMARTPLLREAVDVVVYCLALMGTQLTQYLVEANRVLKNGGQLLIAEVESRFDDVNSFIKDVERLGFKMKSLDKQHSVFFFLHFAKVKEPPVKKGKLPNLTLKPCLYKRR